MSGGWILLLLPGLIWGASFLFIDEGLRAMGPGGVAFVRITVGFLTLACFPSSRRAVGRADWGRVALLGVIWFAFPLTLFPLAEERVSSALTGMLNGANPLFANLVAAWMAGAWPSRGVMTGLGIGLFGAVLMGLPAMGQGESSALGVGMILVALISYGFSLNIARGLQQKYGGVPVIWRAQGVGMVLTAPWGVRDLMVARWDLPGIWAPVLSLLALGALGTGIAYVALTAAAGRFGAAKASGTTFLIPVVALGLGMAVLGERVDGISMAGGAVCLLGAWVMKRGG